MAFDPEGNLSSELRDLAVRSGNEWGWPLHLIPRVIDEAEELNLLSLGGQLQFLLPAGTCECYWVSVEALQDEPGGLDWSARVAFAATNARHQFEGIKQRYDFIAEGRKAFDAHLEAYEAGGGDPQKAMCFIWYLAAQNDGVLER
jgi:hypothetical protein